MAVIIALPVLEESEVLMNVGRVLTLTGTRGARFDYNEWWEGMVSIKEASPGTDTAIVDIRDVFEFCSKFLRELTILNRDKLPWEGYVAWPPPPDIRY